MKQAPELAPPPGCALDRLGEDELDTHLSDTAQLRELVTATHAGHGRVTIHFATQADDARIARFVAAERRCCGSLAITVRADVDGATITYASDEPGDRPALVQIARIFDPSNADSRIIAPTAPKSGAAFAGDCRARMRGRLRCTDPDHHRGRGGVCRGPRDPRMVWLLAGIVVAAAAVTWSKLRQGTTRATELRAAAARTAEEPTRAPGR